MASTYKWTIRFSLLTPILIVICIFLMGGGHGWTTPTVAIFPWATLNVAWQDQLSIPLMIAGVFQFIVYGLLIDNVRKKKRQKMVIAGILLVHTILVIFILVLRNPDWR